MIKFSDFIRKHYPAIILMAVGMGFLLEFWSSALGKMIQQNPLAPTFRMLLFISLPISQVQLILVTHHPVEVNAVLLLSFLFMPVSCWTLARLLVSHSALATGTILVSVVSCAGIATAWIARLKDGTPLGMEINALTTLLAPSPIPSP